MMLTPDDKIQIKRDVVMALRDESEIRKIVIFGSFTTSDNPNDIDIAIFQDSSEKYLPLALKYRRLLDRLGSRFPLDVLPIRPDPSPGGFLEEILKGETIYENSENSIFMDSKYPGHGVLPDGPPDEATCRQCVAIAERVFAQACRECGEPLV